jgi:hypothetical protein
MDRATKIRVARELVSLAREVVAIKGPAKPQWEAVKGRPGRERRRKPGTMGGYEYRDKPGAKKDKPKSKSPVKKPETVKEVEQNIKQTEHMLSKKRFTDKEGLQKRMDDLKQQVDDIAAKAKAEKAKKQVDELVETADKVFREWEKSKNKPAPKKKLDEQGDATFEDAEPSKPKGKKKPLGKHKKSTPKVSSLKKVSNVMKQHKLDEESDELGEMAGFKKTLGQRIPEAKQDSRFYVRNETQLKSDFIKNMNPSNYDSPEAFKKAQERMKKMPTSDFGKLLAAITAEDDTEE